MDKHEISLDFSKEFQEAIVGHMIRDYPFFLKCTMQLEGHWFFDPLVSELFKLSKNFYLKYSRHLKSEMELASEIQKAHPIISDAQPYLTKMNLCILSSKNIGLDVITPDMTGWIKKVKSQDAVLTFVDKHNSKNYSEAQDFLAGEIKIIQQAGFEPDDEEDFTDALSFADESAIEYKDCLTMGHPLFDELLLEGSSIKSSLTQDEMIKKDASTLYKKLTKGSLVKGDTTMILGPSNVGKTTTVISIISANLLCGRRVLYITHEQSASQIKIKIFQNMLRMEREEFVSKKRRGAPTDSCDLIQHVGNGIDKLLTYRSWIKSTDMKVESVIGWINLKQEQSITAHQKGYDLIVVDYPGKLISDRFGRNHSTWEQLDYIYDQFVNLGLEFKSHVILPVQTNRQGLKINQGDASDGRLIGQGEAGGSFGIMQRASNVITLNRTPADVENNIMKFLIAKSRTGATGNVFITSTDFKRSCTHGIHLRAIVKSENEIQSATSTSLSEVLNGNSKSVSPSSVSPLVPIDLNTDSQVPATSSPKSVEEVLIRQAEGMKELSKQIKKED